MTLICQVSLSGNQSNGRERDDRKRSLSVSSAGYTESAGDLDKDKERDKRGRKNSVFGNLFKKKAKKSSKDEDIVRDDEQADSRSSQSALSPVQAQHGDGQDSLR